MKRKVVQTKYDVPELTPGQERSDWLMAEIPDGSTSCTIAYQEYKTDGSKGDAYFVEAAL